MVPSTMMSSDQYHYLFLASLWDYITFELTLPGLDLTTSCMGSGCSTHSTTFQGAQLPYNQVHSCIPPEIINIHIYMLYKNYASIITQNSVTTPQLHPPVIGSWNLNWKSTVRTYSTSALAMAPPPAAPSIGS